MSFLDLFRPKAKDVTLPVPVRHELPTTPPWAESIHVRSEELGPYLVTGYEATTGLRAPSTFQDYQGLFGEGGDDWLHAAIAAVAQDVSDIRIRPEYWRTGEEVDRWPHPALENPYPGTSLQDLAEILAIDLLTTANAFLVLDTSGELHQIPPHRMRIYPDRLGHVHHYALVSKDTGREHVIEPERVVHHRLPNPSNRHWGTGPSQALRTMLLISDGETQYLINFYKNGARPSGFISFDKEMMVQEAKAAMREFNQVHGGKRNHGKTAGLPGASYEATSTTPVDGGVVEVRRLTLQSLLANIGVAPFRLFMLEDADYANAKQQERVYDLKTVLPFARRRIVAPINSNRLLVPDPTRVRLGIDATPTLNMHRDEEAIATAAATAVNAGILTRVEARARGYDLGPMDTAEDVPETGPISALSGLSSPPPPPPATDPSSEPDDDDPAAEDRMVRARDHVRSIRTTPSARAAYERSVTKRREGQVKRQRKAVGPALTEMGRAVLAIVDKYRASHPETRDTEIPQELLDALKSFDFADLELSIEEDWVPEIIRTLAEEGMIKTELIGLKPETFSVSNPQVVEFVQRFGADEVRYVTDATKEAIRGHIENAVREGESVDQLAKRLRESPEVGAPRIRADRIAQTETAAAAGYGTQRAYEQAEEDGVTLRKRWLTVGDSNVRESHSAAEAEGAIPVNNRFSNGLRYPGDPEGDPAERINERCDMLPEVE